MSKPKAFADVLRSKKVGQTPAAEHGGTGPVPPADRLHAKDLAAAEGCSLRTAKRLMKSGALGPVRGRSRRDRWIPRSAYLAYLQTV